MNILAVTSCPTGIAHTYIAAEALEQAAKKNGYNIKVETRGSIGVQNELTEEDIMKADFIILACETKVPKERFANKRVFETSISEAIKDAEGLIKNAKECAQVYGEKKFKINDMATLTNQYKHLMNGVSYLIPFVVIGGVLIALSYMFGYGTHENGNIASFFRIIGARSAFVLVVPILSGYIAYSISDKPALAPGMICGMLSSNLNTSFLGGIISGFLVGYIVYFLSKVKMPKIFSNISSVLILPVLSTLIVSFIMVYIFKHPVEYLNMSLSQWLKGMSSFEDVMLGLVLGTMMAVDMGGPINKTVYAFALTTIEKGAHSSVMAAVMAAGMVPPLGLALASVMFKKYFTQDEREAGKAAWILGLSFITEGAIPFVAADPIRVIPSVVLGSAVSAMLSMLFGCTSTVPHGGIFVIPFITNVLGYIISILVGIVITALSVMIFKKTIKIK